MKKTISFAVAFLLLTTVLVSADLIPLEMPNDIKEIPEPEFAEMPDVTYIGDFSGNLVDTYVAFGGFYWDGDWYEQDYLWPTAESQTSACTTGKETYLANFQGSGTEASGRAWKLDKQSLLNQVDGEHSVNNKVTLWTVNAVPPGGAHTHVFYEEMTGMLDTGLVTHSLFVDGEARGEILAPTVIQTEHTSTDNLFQKTGLNIN